MQNTSQIASGLREIAALLEFSGASKLKLKAYRRAVEVVDTVADLAPLVEQGRLKDLEGIGAGRRSEVLNTESAERFAALVRPIQAGSP